MLSVINNQVSDLFFSFLYRRNALLVRTCKKGHGCVRVLMVSYNIDGTNA